MNNLKNKILIAIPFIVALILRVIFIEQKNLWFDEVYSWHASQYSIKSIIAIAAGDIHPPLFYIVLKFWTLIFSDSVFSMRMLSVAISLFSMVFIYLLCKKIFKSNLEIFFVLLLFAVSPLNIYYSQEVRMFNLNLLLCIGSVYFFLTFLNKPKVLTGVFYLIATTLAVYTHYFAFLIFFTEAAILLFGLFKKEIDFSFLKKFLPYYLGVLILYIPWFGKFFYQVGKGQSWRIPQEMYQVLINTFAFFKEIFFGYYFYFEGKYVLFAVKYLTLLVILFFIIFGLKFIFLQIKKKTTTPLSNCDLKKGNLFYTLMFFIIPLTIGIIISIKSSILLSRYLSITVPYFLIALTYFSFSIKKKYFTYPLVALFLLMSIAGTTITFNHDFKNNDYREIISYIEEFHNEGDIITVDPHYNGWVFKYYCSHNETVLDPPKILGWNLKEKFDSLSQKPDIKNLWFITDYSTLNTTGYDEVSDRMETLGYKLERAKIFSLIPEKVKVGYYRRK